MQTMERKYVKTALALVLLLLISSAGFSQSRPIKELSRWPKGATPQEIGNKVAERLVALPFQNFPNRTEPPKQIIYPEVATWYGALTFAQLSHNSGLSTRLIRRFDPLLGERSDMVPKPTHVDSTVFGTVPLEIFIETKQEKYRELGQRIADAQWDDPLPDGLSKQSRFWIDDMFMITAVQVQAYRATGERKYLDRAALSMSTYLDRLQQPNGLFYHAPDVPFFWGRGNGWVAAGMTEILRSLPDDHPQRARILDGYRKMMQTLLATQDKDGMWHQLLDHPESWPESSCTGMFTFALITGVKNGWLDRKTYAPAARKGWLGLVKYIEPNGDIREVCEGTNKKNDLQYYLDRKRNVGDLHGQAPVLWSASALLR